MNCTLVILTFNEEDCIAACLDSAGDLFESILVIDSGSTDNTLNILQKYKKVKVKYHHFEDYSSQRNFAISEVATDWVFFLDADEIIDDFLKESLKAFKQSERSVFRIRRYNYLWGYRLRFYGEKDFQIRLFPVEKNSIFYKSKVHEYLVYPKDYRLNDIAGAIIHCPNVTINSILRKQINYTHLDVEKHIQKKSSILVLFIKPFYRFIYIYIYKLAILDGYRGLILSCLSFIYDLIVALRYLKYKKEILR
jgi:glycosyltransferase involved in cell wall biosynthesis